MHICTLIFTKSKPTLEELELILEPHCEEVDGEYNEQGFWDWYQVGGRYRGKLLVHDIKNTISGESSWTNENMEIVGVSGCFINNINVEAYSENRNWYDSYSYLSVDGEYNTRSFWDGDNWNDNVNYDKQLAEMISDTNLFVTVVDCHY